MSTANDLSKVNQTSQSSFTTNHKLYDAARPGYPDEVVKFMTGLNRGSRVLEVAAGTGKFTASLVKNMSPEQIAVVEPSPGMLESFQSKFPQIKSIQAAANRLPFPDHSFSTVYIAQAFHWFANRESIAEIHRVLEPGGSLVLVWNYEDYNSMDRDGWQFKTTSLVHEYDGNVPQYRKLGWKKVLEDSSDLFEPPVNERRFPYDRPVPSAEFYWNYMASRSYITALSEDEREALRKKFMSLMAAAPGELVLKVGSHVVWLTAK